MPAAKFVAVYRCPMCGRGMNPPVPRRRGLPPRTHCRACTPYVSSPWAHYLDHDRPPGDPGRGNVEARL